MNYNYKLIITTNLMTIVVLIKIIIIEYFQTDTWSSLIRCRITCLHTVIMNNKAILLIVSAILTL